MKFNTSYNKEIFENFLQSKLFGDKYEKDYKRVPIARQTKFFDDENCFILGKANLDKEIVVIEMKQKSKNDPRITLTKDAFKIMQDLGVYNALVIFYSDDSKSYRLSLLTLKVFFDEKEESNPKRYSYLLGVGEKTKTPEKYLNKTITTFKELKDSFDVEVVRKEFFNHYLDLYIRLYKEIQKDTDLFKILKKENIDPVTFTKNLLGKIVFLYFIQKKGWLGVPRDKEYSKDGDLDFMRNIWKDFKENSQSKAIEKTGNFYNDYLEHLFYDGLNKDRRQDDDFFATLNMRVPYLNGGLFKEDYKDWNTNKAIISNDIFSNSDETGILDIFDRYNFTIDEDDLYDTEMAVDPEMLGRIFEKMISISSDNIETILQEYDKNIVNGRKTKITIDNLLNKKLGAFYTPREIVHYMTKESLIAYLVNNLKGKKEENEKKIRLLFEIKEKFLLTPDDLKYAKLDENIFEEFAGIIEEIDTLLKKVKILDPAIGSGAFPMGLLHEISSIRYYIYKVFFHTFNIDFSDFKNKDGKLSIYLIKKNIIQNNIYGVDISAGAIDIARLRFWLSLVVDEETPEPLPNFEFKFVCANTLIPLSDEKGIFDNIDEEKLRILMRKYYNLELRKEKEEVKQKITGMLGLQTIFSDHISEKEKQLASFRPFDTTNSAEFFDPSLMMGLKRGERFDIVIGNPPYVSSLTENEKSIFSKIYPAGTKKKRLDLFNFFMVYGNNITNFKGTVSFIVPQSWLLNEGNYKLRELLINCGLSKLIILGGSVFDTAVVDTLIYFQNKKYNNDIVNFSEGNIHNCDFILTNEKKITPEIGDFYAINPNQSESVILKKSYIDSEIIGDISKIVFGIQTRKNSSFPTYLSDNIINENCKPVINGKNMFKYSYKYDNNLYVEYGDWLWNMRKPEIFESEEKILLRQVGKIPLCSYDNSKIYTLNTIFNIVIINDKFNIKYVLGILNSKFIGYLWCIIFPESKDIFPRIKKENFIKLPIKQISPEDQKPFIEKVDKILEITKKDFYDPKNPPEEQRLLEDEIDKMVYELYGLSEEEVRVVEEGLK